jgi:hypothetical protein
MNATSLPLITVSFWASGQAAREAWRVVASPSAYRGIHERQKGYDTPNENKVSGKRRPYWPTLNVKSPLTLWVSADTARHSTL